MSVILKTVGKLIDLAHSEGISYLIPVVVVAVFTKMVNFAFANNVYRSTWKKEAMLDEMQKIRERAKKKKNVDVNAEIVSFLGKQRYPMTGFLGVFLLELVIGVLTAFVFRDKMAYLACPDAANAAWIRLQLDQSLFFALRGGAMSSSHLASSIFFFLWAAAMQYFHASTLAGELVVDQTVPDLLMLIAAAVCAAVLPSAFCVYWIAVKALDFLHYYIVKTRK